MEKAKIQRENCKHDWSVLRGAVPRIDEGHGGEIEPAVFKCNNCGLLMTASEALQLVAVENQVEQLRHLKTFQKTIAILTVLISVAALIVSVIALII